MAHWFDRLSERSVDDEKPISRRSVVKGAGLGLAGAAVAAPVAEAGRQILREGACSCQRSAERNFENQLQNYREFFDAGDPTGLGTFYNPIQFGLEAVSLAGLSTGFLAKKLSCGRCNRNPSGSLQTAPPTNVPCRARGGTCVEPPPPGGTGCPDGTSFCAGTLCCFGNDLCCRCNGEATCCVAVIGCTCC